MPKASSEIPVIDLFAGPGGLGEGFSSLAERGHSHFRIGLSVEMNVIAHKTLELRAFFRQFRNGRVPADYYAHLRGEISREELFAKYPEQSGAAATEAWQAELGVADEGELDRRIRKGIGKHKNWVLIGGPPCQAYSVVGRARNQGKKGYRAEEDPRHFLYREYLGIIARHWPAAFVMENVKGLLSCKVGDNRIFQQIMQDLRNPAAVYGNGKAGQRKYDGYRIYSLVRKNPGFDIFGLPMVEPQDFIIESEKYGVPQTRHRVILVGVRADIDIEPEVLVPADGPVSTGTALFGLPRLRGGLSQEEDTPGQWKSVLEGAVNSDWYKEVPEFGGVKVKEKIQKVSGNLKIPKYGRGKEFIKFEAKAKYRPDWYLDKKLGGVCNSTTRAHIAEDLHRYLYASSYASSTGTSPKLKNFPVALHPKHKNVSKAVDSNHFGDRFRVQLEDTPSTTVVSHIAKDGHYYIHPDPTQCRSLTVREAARLQTFPDNYFFCGNRTEQYTQVGNAVPPLLAQQIAQIVRKLLEKVS